MQGKKSFLLYCDMIHIFEELNNEQAGILIKHIFQYVNDQDPALNDQLLKIAFAPIKNALKKDLEEWLKICERNAKNGSKGGRKKNPDEPKEPSGFDLNPNNPVKADKDKDKDKDIIIEEKPRIIYQEYWAMYNKDIEDYRDKLKSMFVNRRSSVNETLNKLDIDYEDEKIKSKIWLDFIKNMCIHIPNVNNEDHAYKSFLKWIKENNKQYKKNKTTTYKNFE